MKLFHFAIPHNATPASRDLAPHHIALHYGVRGPIRFIRRDDRFRLYAVEVEE